MSSMDAAGKKVFPFGIPEDIEKLIYSYLPPPVKPFEAGKTYVVTDVNKIKGWDFFFGSEWALRSRGVGGRSERPAPKGEGVTIKVTKLTPKRIYFSYTLKSGRQMGEYLTNPYSQWKYQNHKALCLSGMVGWYADSPEWESLWVKVENCSIVGEGGAAARIEWAQHWK